MKKLTKLLSGAVALGLLAAPAFAQDAAPADENPLIATVGDQEIRQSDFDTAMSQIPPEARQMPPQQLLPALLDQLISQRLILIEALGSDLTDDAEVAERTAQAKQSIMQDIYLIRFLEKAVPEEAVRARYDETIGAAEPTEDEVHARHILVETEEAAIAVIAQIADGGDFATLAQEHSTGPSGPTGGDLGFFTKGRMVAEFADAAFEMEVGASSQTPVQTQFGWHVIKVEDRRPLAPPSFEASRGEIELTMRQEAVQAHLEELRAATQVTQYDGQGNAIEVPAAEATTPETATDEAPATEEAPASSN